MPGSSFSSISFDNEPACYELTRRLTEKGHRRIGLLVLNSPMNIGADRLAGCLRALREAGVEPDPALVRCCAAAAVDGNSIRYSSYRSPASSRASRASGLSICSMMQASSRRA